MTTSRNDAIAILPRVLGEVERLVGCAQERCRGRAVERVGGDAAAQTERVARFGQPFGEDAPDARAESLGGFRAGAQQHDDELVAAEAPHLCGIGERSGEHVGDLPEERVTELVSGTVVDVLEVVAVEHEHAERQAPLLSDGDLDLEAFLEPTPVENARERVGDGALALAAERERSIERGRRVSCEHGRRIEVLGAHGTAADAEERADVLAVCPQGEPDHSAALPLASWSADIDELMYQRRVDEPARGLELLEGQAALLGGLGSPARELDGPTDVVPHPDLRSLEPEHPCERGRRECRDLVRVAQASEVDEEAGECRQVEPS